jgi:hypothetical protein
MKMRFSKALPMSNFTIDLTDTVINDMSNTVKNVKEGKVSSVLIAEAIILSPDGAPMSNILFYAVSRNKSLQIRVTGITSVVPNGDSSQPWTVYCPEAYFRLNSRALCDLSSKSNSNYSKIYNTLSHMLIDFLAMAELNK